MIKSTYVILHTQVEECLLKRTLILGRQHKRQDDQFLSSPSLNSPELPAGTHLLLVDSERVSKLSPEGSPRTIRPAVKCNNLRFNSHAHSYNKVNITLRKARNNYNKELLKESSNDPEKFWKTLKRIYATPGEENPPCQSFDINGEKCTSMKQIAHGFRSFFRLLSTTLNLKLCL